MLLHNDQTGSINMVEEFQCGSSEERCKTSTAAQLIKKTCNSFAAESPLTLSLPPSPHPPLTDGATGHGGEDPHGGQRPPVGNEGVRLPAVKLPVSGPLPLVPGTGKAAHSIWDDRDQRNQVFLISPRENKRLIPSFGRGGEEEEE